MGRLPLPETKNPAIPQVVARNIRSDRERSREEYRVIYAAFGRLVDGWENSAERWDVMEEIITLRASFLIDHALTGLNIDLDRALEILRGHNDFVTGGERQQRDILVAAIDNLIEFAAAEECAMMSDPDLETAIEEGDEEECEAVFARYNGAGAAQENEDVLYAAAIAAWWLGVSAETLVTFMTMGDERVRPWHEAYEGYSYRKSEFPPELIPPIEWGCRCFLIADGFASVAGSLSPERKTIAANPIFRESLATGGRIFSDGHPYFQKPLPPQARKIVETIKSKFYR